MAMSKILIIDDDGDFVHLLSEDLVSYGQFTVLTATTKGDETFILKNEMVSLVVVDIDAHHIDRCAFLSLMSSTYPNIPCIILTRKNLAQSGSIDETYCKDSIFSYMTKPADMQKIGGAILEGLYRLDENDFTPGICAARLLHLLNSENKTGRIQVKFGTKKQGLLDVDNGVLVNAFCEDKEGEDAAREIISWPPLGFKFENLPEGNRSKKISPQFFKDIPVMMKAQTAELPGKLDEMSIVPDLQQKIKLFIVDDSRMMRKVVSNVFENDETVEVVGEAANGEEALQILPQLKPDVVTLDVQMPVMDGLTTLKHMMIQVPTPTVMLSAYTREGSEVTYDALKYGAVDFVAKPSNQAGLDLSEQKKEILNKIHLAAGVELGALKYIRTVKKDKETAHDQGVCETIIAIGAAEGGYGTLLKIIPHLPPSPTTTYLVSLYASPEHVDSFVDYLQKYSVVEVRRAESNVPAQGGVCYVASGEEYLSVHDEGANGLDLHLSQAPFAGRRGSINMLMFSVAEIMKQHSMGIILTGLGNDGIEGLSEINRVGGKAIVQSPKGCLYREMPEMALAEFSDAQVVPDTGIAGVVQEFIASK